MTFINTYITKLAGVFYTRSKVLLAIAGILLLSGLIACASTDGDGGGSDDTYTVGGTVTGHTGDVSLDLTYGEKTETLEVPTGTDKFTFAAKLEANQSFTIAVANPDGQSCSSSVTQGSIVNANITNVEIVCVTVPTYSVGGAISGLAEGDAITLTLFPTGGIAEDKVITGNADETTDDSFTFGTKLANGVTYTVAVTTQPARKTCEIAPVGEQTMGEADVTDIAVTCVLTTYSISGTVNEAADNSLITITLLHADSITPTLFNPVTIDVIPNATDGTYSFTGILENKYYVLSVTSATANEVCTVKDRNLLSPITADITLDIQIDCSIAVANTYSVSGTISGLTNGENIIMNLFPIDGNAELRVITADADSTTADNFAFNTKLVANATYVVAVTTQQAGKSCTVNKAGTQTMGAANVTDIEVTCIPAYSVSGTVTGATNNENTYVVMTTSDDNAGAGATRQKIKAAADGTFSFTGIPANKFYTLQASSITVGETCSATPTILTALIADVTGAMVTCTASSGPFIRIHLTSLEYEVPLTTANVFIGDSTITDTSGTPTHVVNGSDADVVIIPDINIRGADGFYYDIPINAGQYYAVTVTTTSTNESCGITSNGTGGPVNDNVTVEITCD